jgi:hypothetical protein
VTSTHQEKSQSTFLTGRKVDFLQFNSYIKCFGSVDSVDPYFQVQSGSGSYAETDP